jgi:hypothetical protein
MAATPYHTECFAVFHAVVPELKFPKNAQKARMQSAKLMLLLNLNPSPIWDH